MIELASAHIDSGVAEETPVLPIYPQTLVETVRHVTLTDNETKAILAADALRIEFPQKQSLVAAHIILTEPGSVLRAQEVLRITVDQVVEARDQVVTNPDFAQIWQQHQVLTANPILASVAIYKRARHSQSKIAEETGLDVKTVGKIFTILVDLGVTEDTRAHVVRFREFCEEVEKADSQGEPLSTIDLAQKLDPKARAFRVKRARKRNRMHAKAAAPGKEIFGPQGQEIRVAILTHPGLGDTAIAGLINKGYTPRQIGWQRFQLYQEGLTQRWRATPGVSDANNKSTPRSVEAKIVLSGILDEYVARKEDIVLVDIRRDGPPSLRKVGLTTLYKLYKDLASEPGRKVPALKFSRPSR
jgi:hypothetical protein